MIIIFAALLAWGVVLMMGSLASTLVPGVFDSIEDER